MSRHPNKRVQSGRESRVPEEVQPQGIPEAVAHSGIEDELRQKAELVDLSREAIFVTDHQGKIVVWNRGAERLYGWSQAEAMDKSPVELLRTELPRTMPQIENILRREGHWDCELRQTTRQGNQITVAS